MAKTTLRNAIVLAVGATLYALLIRHLSAVFDWMGVASGRFGAGLAVHLVFGVLGAFAFAGRPGVRAALVFLCIALYGLAMEMLLPDARHWGAQLFASIAFGMVAAVAALIASFALRRDSA